MPPDWTKMLGELLADHEIAQRKQIEPLAARIAELEARPAGTDELPADLVAQINDAKQLLQEMPQPIAAAAVNEEQQPVLRHITGSIITRAGDLAVFYSDGSSERLGSVVGPQGPSGAQGPSGRDGSDGMKGDEGRRGRDGVSVATAGINRRGELVLTLSDGTVHVAGRVVDEKRT